MKNNIQLTIEVPGVVRDIIRRLKKGGYEAYIVGGCVRDAFLGLEPKDWDITTSALPEQVKSLFSNTADTGIQHGTVMVLSHGTGYEVTTYRIDGEYKDGRHPESVRFTPSLAEDLKRRDFTINAFAYDPEEGVVDLFHGIEDLENRLIRCVGDPDARFGEDALRIMRAVRFSAQLSFTIEPATLTAIRGHVQNLAMVSIERIHTEFEKTLLSSNPEKVNLYADLGIGIYIVRDEELCRKCFDPAFDRQYREVQGTPQDVRILRLAVFFGNLTEEETKKVLRKMKSDNKTIQLVSGIIKNKDRLFSAERTAVRRLLHEIGPEMLRLVLEFRQSRLRAQGCPEATEEERALLSEVLQTAEKILADGEPFRISDLKINGKDLLLQGFPQNDSIGDALNRLLEMVIEDPAVNEKELLLTLAKQFIE